MYKKEAEEVVSKIGANEVKFEENWGKSLDFFVKICYTIANIAVHNLRG